MKPYAVIILSGLTVRKFDSKDEAKIAIAELDRRDISHLVLRWSDDAQAYCHIDTAIS